MKTGTTTPMASIPANRPSAMAWAERNSLADGQWLGYQWDNPEIGRPFAHGTEHFELYAQLPVKRG